MVRFVGVDVASDTITLEFQYKADTEDLIMDIVKKKLGKDVPLDEFADGVEEIEEIMEKR